MCKCSKWSTSKYYLRSSVFTIFASDIGYCYFNFNFCTDIIISLSYQSTVSLFILPFCYTQFCNFKWIGLGIHEVHAADRNVDFDLKTVGNYLVNPSMNFLWMGGYQAACTYLRIHQQSYFCWAVPLSLFVSFLLHIYVFCSFVEVSRI